MKKHSFTIDGYRSTVRGVLSQGYTLSDFHAADPKLPQLILRHDVDQSLPRARMLAKAEANEGWRATYFILLRTEMYNAWSRDNTATLRAIRDMGHEIGLHLDATYYNGADLEAGASVECRHLEDIVGTDVRLISFHRPAPALMGGSTTIAGRRHTYMDRYIKEMGYSSDSRGEWRHGHPWDHSSIKEKRALQLLTHAVWWTGEEPGQPREQLANVLDEATKRIDREMADNNEIWKEREVALPR